MAACPEGVERVTNTNMGDLQKTTTVCLCAYICIFFKRGVCGRQNGMTEYLVSHSVRGSAWNVLLEQERAVTAARPRFEGLLQWHDSRYTEWWISSSLVIRDLVGAYHFVSKPISETLPSTTNIFLIACLYWSCSLLITTFHAFRRIFTRKWQQNK